jgi:glycosidase
MARRLQWFAALLVACGCAPPAPAAGALHLPSPDWRAQVIYFAMIDRFDDGDPGNNDQGQGEYDPASGAHYSGGDLAGLRRRLDYIQGLGATALWITPPVRHQWWDGSIGYGGYHGYWGEHFAQVDPHFGSLDDYRALSRALHARGMYLVQDVVVNHTGNYFSYPPGHEGRDAARDHARNPSPGAHAAPTQWPFTLNDARDPQQRAADIYHWTPDIVDFGDPRQERDFQLSALDDLNTENPVVRRALRASYGHWIRQAGVDAFRVDTAFYVPPEFFRDFLQADDAAAPGVLRVAAQTGRHGFHVFGEGFGVDPPLQEAQARKIERWARDAQGPLLPAMINFPLYGSLLDVFARGQPAAALAHRIDSMMRLHAAPHLMPSFVDNHDVDRFLAGGSEAGLRQALLAIFTLPGIPVVYYGTEQGYTVPRAALFARGYGSGGRDRFDASAPLYRYLVRLAALRRAHPVLWRGTPRVLVAEAGTPGALGWRMEAPGEQLLVLFNSADHAVLATAESGLPRGSVLVPVFAIEGEPAPARVQDDGRLLLELPARSGQVWRVAAAPATTDATPAATPPRIATAAGGRVGDELVLAGTAAGSRSLRLVVDGDLARASLVPVAADGRWSARLDVRALRSPAERHAVLAWDPARGLASPAQTFFVQPAWTTRVVHEDPPRDDHGPGGRYVYPTDPQWRLHRPADLRRIEVATSGSALRFDVALNALVAGWNPPLGFDHVALTFFLELPGEGGGARLMPGQHATLPGDMRWHYRWRVGGWNAALFRAEAAGASHEGTPVPASFSLEADREKHRLRITLPIAALGAADLRGARLYVTTWDYDGGYRALAPVAGPFVFGGGDADDARVMDDSGVLELR